MADVGQEIGSGYVWSSKVKIWCTEKYILLESPILVQRAYRKEFKCKQAPGRKTLLKWRNQFRTLGDLGDQRATARDGTPHSGRPKVRTEELIAKVSESVENSPKRSLCRRSQCLGINYRTLQRIMTIDLDLFPYRISVRQKLEPAQKKKRLEMAL